MNELLKIIIITGIVFLAELPFLVAIERKIEKMLNEYLGEDK